MMFQIEDGALYQEYPFALYYSAFAAGALTTFVVGDDTYLNAINPQTFDFWNVGGYTTNYITSVRNTIAGCDCCCVVGHNFDKLTNPIISVYYSVDGINNWTLCSRAWPTGKEPLCMIFPRVEAKGWRFQVYRDALTTEPVIAYFMIGGRIIFPTDVAPPYVSLAAAERSELMVGVSSGGNYIGNRVKRRGIEADITLNPVETSWTTEFRFTDFTKFYNGGMPFFFGASPLYMPGDIGFVWRDENAPELRPSIRAGGYYADLKLQVAGYAA